MFKLDAIDRKILKSLDVDGRQSYAQIAKTARTSKQVVKYRIDKLLADGVITNFYTIINVGELGYDSYYVYLKLGGANQQAEQAVLQQLKKHHAVGWIVRCTGRWDIVLLLFAKSVSDFDSTLNSVLLLCQKHIREHAFSFLITSEHIGYPFLEKKRSPLPILQTEKKGNQTLTKREQLIMKSLDQDGRKSLVDTAQEVNCPVYDVHYAVKKLKKNNILSGIKPKVNLSKIGVQWHLIILELDPTSEKERQSFLNYCREHHAVYYITRCVGRYTIMLDVHVSSSEELRTFLYDLEGTFPTLIRATDTVMIFEEAKISYVPW